MININWQNGAESFIDAVSSSSPAPGGGAAAAVSAATGCALAMMAVSITIKMKAMGEEDKKILNKYLDELIVLRDALKAAALADAKAYEEVIRAKKLPAGSKEREGDLNRALQLSSQVPLATAKSALEVLEKIQSFESKIAKVIMSDIDCAKILLKASVACCAQNIKANLPYIRQEDFKSEMQESLNFLSKFC